MRMSGMSRSMRATKSLRRNAFKSIIQDDGWVGKAILPIKMVLLWKTK